MAFSEKQPKNNLEKINKPEEIWRLVKRDEYDYVKDPNIKWYENLKVVLKKARFQSPLQVKEGPLKLKEIKSKHYWNFKWQLGKDFFWFITLENPDDENTLRLWEIPFEEYKKMDIIDLDLLTPTHTGIEARQFIIDNFHEGP